MEKIILAIGLIAILMGCTQIQTKDCGTDLDCFNESLLKCEKAKVKYTETYAYHSAIMDDTPKYLTENSEAEITGIVENKKYWPEDYPNLCEVNVTNMKFVSLPSEKETQKEKLKCYFDTETINKENRFRTDSINLIHCEETK